MFKKCAMSYVPNAGSKLYLKYFNGTFDLKRMTGDDDEAEKLLTKAAQLYPSVYYRRRRERLFSRHFPPNTFRRGIFHGGATTDPYKPLTLSHRGVTRKWNCFVVTPLFLFSSFTIAFSSIELLVSEKTLWLGHTQWRLSMERSALLLKMQNSGFWHEKSTDNRYTFAQGLLNKKNKTYSEIIIHESLQYKIYRNGKKSLKSG